MLSTLVTHSTNHSIFPSTVSTELNVSELDRFHMLYRPVFAFIGVVEVVFPLGIGGKLEVR